MIEIYPIPVGKKRRGLLNTGIFAVLVRNLEVGIVFILYSLVQLRYLNVADGL